MMAAATAASAPSTYGSRRLARAGEVVTMCKTDPQQIRLFRSSHCAAGSHTHTHTHTHTCAAVQYSCRPQCATTSFSSNKWSSSRRFINLCKDAKLTREVKCLSSVNWRREQYSSRMAATRCTSQLTDVSRSSISSAVNINSELYTTISTATTYNNYKAKTTTTPRTDISPSTGKPEEDEVGVQELTVYEVNELDRCSPMLLSLSKLAVDWHDRFSVQLLGRLGDMVPFTNKIFDGSLKKRLGITAGIISVIRHYPEEDGLLFEAVYSLYFGDYGHISLKGAYKSHEKTVLAVTGGSGVFTGVYGTVEIQNVEYPFVLFYKFQLYGIPKLPQALRWDTVPPAKGIRPSRTASMPGVALPNFTD